MSRRWGVASRCISLRCILYMLHSVYIYLFIYIFIFIYVYAYISSHSKGPEQDQLRSPFVPYVRNTAERSIHNFDSGPNDTPQFHNCRGGVMRIPQPKSPEDHSRWPGLTVTAGSWRFLGLDHWSRPICTQLCYNSRSVAHRCEAISRGSWPSHQMNGKPNISNTSTRCATSSFDDMSDVDLWHSVTMRFR